MGQRLDLQSKLENLLVTEEEPTKKLEVYFQAPPSNQMVYPCIVYDLTDERVQFADDRPYHRTKRYTATIIDQDPDSEIPGKVAELPLCRFDRHYAADNLHHYVYNIFF